MYCVYRHIRLDKNVPFYIGIATKRKNNYPKSKLSTLYDRAFTKSGRNDIWKRIINKTQYEVEILYESDCYSFIQNKEIEFISLYKRIKDGGTLCNLTFGGEGFHGHEITEIQRKKFSEKKKGNLNPNRIYPYTEERRKKLSLALKGQKRTNEQKERIRKSNYRNRPICCLTNGVNYESASLAAKHLFPENKHKTARTSVARSATFNIQYKGFYFKWDEDYEFRKINRYTKIKLIHKKRWNTRGVICLNNNKQYKTCLLAVKDLFTGDSLNYKNLRNGVGKAATKNIPYKGFSFKWLSEIKKPPMPELSSKPDK